MDESVDRRARRDGLHQITVREEPRARRRAAKHESSGTLTLCSGRLSRYENAKLLPRDLA